MADDPKSLIAELESAKCATRELDFKIGSYLGWEPPTIEGANPAWAMWLGPDGNTEQLPWWSTSIDSALTLANTGGMIRIAFDMPNNFATVYFKAGGIAGDGKAPTPALALTIAALKTREDD